MLTKIRRTLLLLLSLLLLTALLPTDAFAETAMPLTEGVESHIADYGYAYVTTTRAATVYSTADLTAPVFTITQDAAVLFAFEYNASSLKVCFITEESEMLVGYVATEAVADTIIWDEDADAMARDLWAELICTDYGELYIFVVQGALFDISNGASAYETTERDPSQYSS